VTPVLRLGLWAEGPSDIEFLQRVLFRSTYESVHDAVDFVVDIDPTFLRIDLPSNQLSRRQRIADAFAPVVGEGTATIVFVHSDSDGDAEGAQQRNVQPGLELLAERVVGHRFAGVPVIPVRNTEAWALADPVALKEVIGTGLDDAALGLPEELARSPLVVERLAHTKDVLKAVHLATSRHTPRRRVRPVERLIPTGLGDAINLNRLRQLQAFQRFEADLLVAVRKAFF
jgi:hypothetical protein